MFWLLFGAIIEVEDKTSMFKCIRGHHKYNLESLEPSTLGIEYDKKLHLPKEELENFRIQMEMGV